MGLSENIFKALQLLEPSAPCYYKVTILGGVGVYVEGVSKILELTKDKIVLLIKKEKILVEGKNLKIKSFINNDIAIHGEVVSVVKV